MLTEGIGIHKPKPKTLSFTRQDINYLDGAARKIEQFRGYSQRHDKWGKGYIDRPVFCGMCGELALCRFLNDRLGTNLTPDTKLRPLGDGGRDIVLDSVVFQVKTIVTGHKCLIRRVDSRHRLKALGCEIFVFARLALPRVSLLGWITAMRASEAGKSERSTRDDHWNLRVPEDELGSMDHLLNEIISRRAS